MSERRKEKGKKNLPKDPFQINLTRYLLDGENKKGDCYNNKTTRSITQSGCECPTTAGPGDSLVVFYRWGGKHISYRSITA